MSWERRSSGWAHSGSISWRRDEDVSEPLACPHCGAGVEPGQQFCGWCGKTLALTCSACGVTNPLTFKFCGNCGAELLHTPAKGAVEERRVVTVLFADLVGFTARAETMDPEDVRAILSPYYGRLRTDIEAFGGTVEKFIGDAVMAVFGAPVAHGDDPERAVRAALAVRHALEEMNEVDPELDLQVRLAVNTGEAIVSLGARAGEGEGMVAGDVVNTAARLQSVAPVGAILVGEETQRSTRTLFEYEEVAPLDVKGKREPVRAWLAVRASSAPGERVGKSVPMVGRDHEVAMLHRIWDGVVNERRVHLVTVFGEPGIGKTRLGAEFAAQIEEQDARTLRGRLLPYGASTPYGPFTQHVKQLASIFASDSVPVARDKLRAAIGGLFEADAEEVALHLEMLMGLATEGEVADREILFFSARRFVEALARAQPTVLLFEDLHWADSSTLDLLELLASRVREVPLLLLVLARPELLLVRASWGGGLPAYTALPLEHLGATAALELTQRLLPDETRGAIQVVERAEGNPLFIEELAASVLERPAEGAGGRLPTTIREIVSARLDALPAAERPVLLDASVVGRVFWRGALERLGGDGTRLSEALDSLEARDLIRRESLSWIEGEHQYSFKHALIREVAYATLPRAGRRERHSAVAGFLEEATAGAAATATALAEHWREAGEPARAVDYLLVAAEQAGRGWAKDEALALLKQASELVPEEDAARRREIARRQALADMAAYHVADARLLARRSEPESSDP
jgi:class 3 adenylate cyclase